MSVLKTTELCTLNGWVYCMQIISQWTCLKKLAFHNTKMNDKINVNNLKFWFFFIEMTLNANKSHHGVKRDHRRKEKAL